MKLRAVALLAAAVALAVTVTSCSSDTSGPAVKPTVKTALVSLMTLPDDLPVARAREIDRCVRAAGFDIPHGSVPISKPHAALVGVQGLFASAESARRSGYGETIKEDEGGLDAYERSLSSAEKKKFDRVWHGTDSNLVSITLGSGASASRPSDGCYGKADENLYGSVKNGLLVENFANEVASAVQGHDIGSAIRKNIGDYSACMRSAGYPVRDLNAGALAAKKFGRYRSSDAPPSRAEQSMAETDFGCQAKAHLADDVNDLFFTQAGAWIASNEAMILGRFELVRAAETRARALLDD